MSFADKFLDVIADLIIDSFILNTAIRNADYETLAESIVGTTRERHSDYCQSQSCAVFGAYNVHVTERKSLSEPNTQSIRHTIILLVALVRAVCDPYNVHVAERKSHSEPNTQSIGHTIILLAALVRAVCDAYNFGIAHHYKIHFPEPIAFPFRPTERFSHWRSCHRK